MLNETSLSDSALPGRTASIARPGIRRSPIGSLADILDVPAAARHCDGSRSRAGEPVTGRLQADEVNADPDRLGGDGAPVAPQDVNFDGVLTAAVRVAALPASPTCDHLRLEPGRRRTRAAGFSAGITYVDVGGAPDAIPYFGGIRYDGGIRYERATAASATTAASAMTAASTTTAACRSPRASVTTAASATTAGCRLPMASCRSAPASTSAASATTAAFATTAASATSGGVFLAQNGGAELTHHDHRGPRARAAQPPDGVRGRRGHVRGRQHPSQPAANGSTRTSTARTASRPTGPGARS